MNIGLILAGGLGLRMDQSIEMPKQFYRLMDKPVLFHTVERFESHDEIDSICIVYLPTWENYIKDCLDHFQIKKVHWLVPSGVVRQESVYNGLCALEKDCDPNDIVLVHDGVRPFVTKDIITQNIAIAREFGNAMTSIQSTDTIISSFDGKVANNSMDRDTMFSVQTPQTYSLGYGLETYRKAYLEGKTNFINCCEMFMEYGKQVYLVHGRKTNIKMTTEEDIAFLNVIHKIFHCDEKVTHESEAD